ncbi:hypothetical protein [Dysosmobacter welbionis]|uniref:hypothetical protein n=1 Tax=Dysosmobacter welbionis TaxID=2093857 RepID=UPI0023549DE8|nr:hypothetical protein [Dysosmobacter welbionis]
MSELKGACIFGQSGMALLPSSTPCAYGVIATALKNPSITRVLGAEHGIKGVLNDRLFDMGQEETGRAGAAEVHPLLCPGLLPVQDGGPDVDDTDYKRILGDLQEV